MSEIQITRAALRALSRTPVHLFDLMAGTYDQGYKPGDLAVLTTTKARLQVTLDFQRAHDLTVDGHPGSATFARLWALCKPGREEAIARAIAAAGASEGTIYRLGAGGFGWFEEVVDDECDCSGLIAHVLGRTRKPAPDWELNGTRYWFSTDSIWLDATTHERLFRRVTEPEDGAIGVYPDWTDNNGKRRQGHVWIYTDAAADRGVDCSWSQYHRKGGDAIKVRDLSKLTRKAGAVFCIPAWWS